LENKTFFYEKPLPLECGEILENLEIAYSTWGNIQYDTKGHPTNVVWICHALTANSNAAEWWPGMVGEGKLFDPQKYFIVCANMLGSCYGTSNALSVNPKTEKPYYHDFPLITVRDMVASLDILRNHLNINKIYLCTGGSMGGQQALEWAIVQPNLIENLVLMASNAKHSPWGIAFNESQRMAIVNDPTWKEKSPTAGLEGMKTARSLALLSYRNYDAYQITQPETDENKLDDFKASSYQQYQGEKLAKRFHAFSYWTLSKAMDSHNIARNRGTIEQALKGVKSETLVLGIKTDILFPIEEQKLMAEHIPHAVFEEIDSAYGHDGFLIENEKITQALKKFQTSFWEAENKV
jgi:homoserine O-acetyltransferase/O-succinyltransferase